MLALKGLIAWASLAPAQAARPLLDQHQWDRAFALFARDSNVPWRETTVRLETYSSAPVDFKAYAVDAPDVIVAGRPQGRPYDTNGRTPVAHWRFSPPSGYRVEGNTVALPLGAREGLFVIEARRGRAVEQVWVNRTRIGLVGKESPEGLVVYGTDLGSGKPLANLRMLFLVGSHLEKRMTDRHGLVYWQGSMRPRFVLAEWGASRAFLSFLPEAPVPHALAVVRVDRAVVRGGEDLNVVGFARRRVGQRYAGATGPARVSLFFHGREITSANSILDSGGAFHVRLHIPNVDTSGTAAVLVNAGGANAGTGVQIDAAADVSLTVTAECGVHCAPNQPVPLLFEAKRQSGPAARVPLSIRVVRYPHIFPPGTHENSEESWGATSVIATKLPTNDNGRLRISIPAAADGLPSTFGIEANTTDNAASASTRLELPNSAVALEVRPERDIIDVRQSISIEVRAFAPVDGRPVGGTVQLTLSHGPVQNTQTVTLDKTGRARALFHNPQYGENFIAGRLSSDAGTANDENAVSVQPRALSEENGPRGTAVTVNTDHTRYRPDSRVVVDAVARGAVGAALLSIDNRALGTFAVVPVRGGTIHGSVALGDPQGVVEAGVAYVHQGYLLHGSTALEIDGPGHERQIDLAGDADHYAPGAIAKISIKDGTVHESATTIVRVTDEIPSGGADFDSAGDVLSVGGATTQVSASDDPPWHAWVSPIHSRARDLFTDINRRPSETEPPPLSDAYSKLLLWRAERLGADVSVPVPKTPGRYILSVLRMYDDGDVGAASLTLVVE